MTDVRTLADDLRSRFGDRPPGDAMLEALERCDSDDDRAALEAQFIRQTDNGPRPEDGDQSLAVAPTDEGDE